ncbi:MAG: GNAT family protein [Anaerolineales bacterium]|nr:GNAT family protein [Anaerolineales bacterium]
MTPTFKPMDSDSARLVLHWRYDPPYDFYNPDPKRRKEDLELLLDPLNEYYTICAPGGALAAFCCFGREGQVYGGDYSTAALDIGLALRPDLTGRGEGIHYVNAVLDFACREFSPRMFRVTIAGFNLRARRVWKKAGFRLAAKFLRQTDRSTFFILTRRA